MWKTHKLGSIEFIAFLPGFEAPGCKDRIASGILMVEMQQKHDINVCLI